MGICPGAWRGPQGCGGCVAGAGGPAEGRGRSRLPGCVGAGAVLVAGREAALCGAAAGAGPVALGAAPCRERRPCGAVAATVLGP